MISKHLPAQFVNWRMIKGAKVPVGASGFPINPHDPSAWMTYEDAAAQGNVAFVLTADDPWFFLDMDKCLTPENQWTPEALAILENFSGAFYEVSQSSRGLHIMGKCRPEILQNRRNKWNGWLEFYTQKRFVAFGPHGWHPVGDTLDATRDWTDTLERVVPLRDLDRPGDVHGGPGGPDPEWRGPADDDELIARALSSGGGAAARFGQRATFRQLWEADPALGNFYPDEQQGRAFDWSSADSALCFHLAFWTGKDMVRMDRLFRRSALFRDKWDKRSDYRAKTLSDAVRACTSVYVERQVPAGENQRDLFLTLDEQIEYFRGCIYVRDLHKVMVPDGTLLKPDQFRATYSGHQFQMQADNLKPTTNAFEAFVENRMHRFPKCNTVIWHPQREPGVVIDNAVNTWVPPKIKRRRGDPTPFLDLVTKMLPDERDQKILLNWARSVVQNQGQKFQWAPVLQGCEGNGKSAFAEFVAHAVGKEYTHKPNTKNLTEKFNDYIERKLLIIAEEIDMGGRREMLDILKELITNMDVEVRAMAENKRMTRNFANWILLTNYKDAVIKNRGDRRYAIFFTAQQEVEHLVRDGMDGDYFPRLWNWARVEGFEVVADYLATSPIDIAYDPARTLHRAPETSSTHEAVKVSAGAIETEIMDACEDGTIGFRGGWISSLALGRMFSEKHIRLSKAKWGAVLATLGYQPCPGLPDGRAPRALMNEGGKRPVLYRLKGAPVGADPLSEYAAAQGYAPPAGVSGGSQVQ